MITEGPGPNLISFNTVMDCAVCTLQGMNNSVEHRRSSHRGSSGSIRGEIQVAARKPWTILYQLVALGLEADRYTCSTLVKGMHLAGCTVAEIDHIVTLLRRMGPVSRPMPGVGYSAGCVGSPTNAEWLEVIFNTLLDAGVSVRDLDCMTEMFTLMRDFEVINTSTEDMVVFACPWYSRQALGGA